MENESKADRRYEMLKALVRKSPWLDNDGTGGEFCLFCMKEHELYKRCGKPEASWHEEDCIWMKAKNEVENGK